jgi:hypothetical protein
LPVRNKCFSCRHAGLAAPQYAPTPAYVYSTTATPYQASPPQVVYYTPGERSSFAFFGDSTSDCSNSHAVIFLFSVMPYGYSVPQTTVTHVPRPATLTTITAPPAAHSGTPPTRTSGFAGSSDSCMPHCHSLNSTGSPAGSTPASSGGRSVDNGTVEPAVVPAVAE